MFNGPQFVDQLQQVGVTHVVWLPDSLFGPWEEALQLSPIELMRVCREGEAWPLAAGLLLGGARPLIVMQVTGFFESGDALRNVLYDLQLPVYAVVGLRNWNDANSSDSARHFALPILRAWQLDFQLLERPDQQHRLAEHYRRCRQQRRAGVTLLAE